MSDGLNRWMGIGNLGADPELRMTGGGQAVLKLRIACSETYLDKNKVKQERTEWVSVVVWGKRGEALSKILSKGSRIFVEGGLRTSSYDDKEGKKRYRTEIVASNIILSGDRSGGVQRRETTPPNESDGANGYDDRDYGAKGGDDGDIPF